MRHPKKVVAVVVPLCNRPGLTQSEQISLQHLRHFLGKYDKFMLAPTGLEVARPDFHIKRFPDRFFGSPLANTRLMLSPEFYEAFDEYRYLLVYQLDALVFCDQLLEWCETNLDYIGAPWIHCPDSPWVRVPRVGNGGFSLRKVESFRRVLHSDRYQIEPARYWTEFCRSRSTVGQVANLPRKYLKRLRMFNSATWEASRWHLQSDGTRNEDHFWSDRATSYDPEFTIASVATGLRFAFECGPRLCFEMNNRQLPFGCHAWERYDRAFWEPYLLK